MRTRLQDKNSSFAGPMDVLKKIVQSEGLLGLYSGMEATFWRYEPRTLLQFSPFISTIVDMCGGMVDTSGIGYMLLVFLCPFNMLEDPYIRSELLCRRRRLALVYTLHQNEADHPTDPSRGVHE